MSFRKLNSDIPDLKENLEEDNISEDEDKLGVK